MIGRLGPAPVRERRPLAVRVTYIADDADSELWVIAREVIDKPASLYTASNDDGHSGLPDPGHVAK